MTLFALLAFFATPMTARRRPPRRILRVEVERNAAAAALDRLPIGVILIDERGELIACNFSARRILDQRDGLCEDDGMLRGSTHAQTLALHRSLRSAAEGGAEHDRSLSLTRPSGERPLELLLVPADSDPDPDAPRIVTLFVTDPADAAGPDTDVLQRLYGLTPAEACFASLIAQGRKLEEIAKLQDISLHTARGHLKNIFAKTGTHRQANLVRLLVTCPAQLRMPA